MLIEDTSPFKHSWLSGIVKFKFKFKFKFTQLIFIVIKDH